MRILYAILMPLVGAGPDVKLTASEILRKIPGAEAFFVFLAPAMRVAALGSNRAAVSDHRSKPPQAVPCFFVLACYPEMVKWNLGLSGCW
jgi:hypothetical protein